jgi:hypothetical protein
MDESVDETERPTAAADRERIGEGLFANCAKVRSSAALVDRLSFIGIDDKRVSELADLVRRAGSLIYQRPDPVGQASRDVFLDALLVSIARIAPAIAIAPLERAICTVRVAERGHHIILGTLEQTDIAKQSPAMRAAAAIARVEANLAILRKQLNEAMRKDGVTIPGGAMIQDEHGRPLSADVVLTALTESLGGTLMMESYAHGWFGQNGRVELPPLPSAGDREIVMAGSSEYLAMSWRRWERFHRIARYLGEDIDELTGEDRPKGLPEQITTVFTRAGRVNLPDWIANERALDREGIATADLMVMADAAARASGIDGPLPLAPDGWVSFEEIANCLSLSEAVGYEIVHETERHGGLRLVQWVRGYIALSSWASERLTTGNAGILQTTRNELVGLLTRLSLTETEATIFLDAVSFSRTSRDVRRAPCSIHRWVVADRSRDR